MHRRTKQTHTHIHKRGHGVSDTHPLTRSRLATPSSCRTPCRRRRRRRRRPCRQALQPREGRARLRPWNGRAEGAEGALSAGYAVALKSRSRSAREMAAGCRAAPSTARPAQPPARAPAPAATRSSHMLSAHHHHHHHHDTLAATATLPSMVHRHTRGRRQCVIQAESEHPPAVPPRHCIACACACVCVCVYGSTRCRTLFQHCVCTSSKDVELAGAAVQVAQEQAHGLKRRLLAVTAPLLGRLVCLPPVPHPQHNIGRLGVPQETIAHATTLVRGRRSERAREKRKEGGAAGRAHTRGSRCARSRNCCRRRVGPCRRARGRPMSLARVQQGA
jgi:hypothetical protein